MQNTKNTKNKLVITNKSISLGITKYFKTRLLLKEVSSLINSLSPDILSISE